jgi:hypothetical protein
LEEIASAQTSKKSEMIPTNLGRDVGVMSCRQHVELVDTPRQEQPGQDNRYKG